MFLCCWEGATLDREKRIFEYSMYLVTWAERQEKDSRRSGKFQSCFLGDKIAHAKSVGFRFESVIWRSECRISSKHLEITSSSLIYYSIYSRKKELLFWFARVWTDLPAARQIREDGLADCATATQGNLECEKQLQNYALLSGQDWARKFETFRFVSAISVSETGITSRYLGITLSSFCYNTHILIYSRNKWLFLLFI